MIVLAEYHAVDDDRVDPRRSRYQAIGARGLAEDKVEVKRRDSSDREQVPLPEVTDYLLSALLR